MKLLFQWLARLTSLVSASLLAMMATDSPRMPSYVESWALLLFPVGVVIGFGISWWKEVPGAIVSLLSLAAFYLYMNVGAGRLPEGPWFLVFTSPALLFLVAAAWPQARATRPLSTA